MNYDFLIITAAVVIATYCIKNLIKEGNQNGSSSPEVMDYLDLQHEQINNLSKQVKILGETVDDLEKRQDKIEETVKR